MSPEVKVIVRTADQTRKSEVTMKREYSAGDLVQASLGQWKLATDVGYELHNATRQTRLAPDDKLTEDRVAEGDVLEIRPVLVAGAR